MSTVPPQDIDDEQYLTELDLDENGNTKPLTAGGRGIKFTDRAVRAQRAVSTPSFE